MPGRVDYWLKFLSLNRFPMVEPKIGDQKGNLTVIGIAVVRKGAWLLTCRCSCGQVVSFPASWLFGNRVHIASCNINGHRWAWTKHGGSRKVTGQIKPEYKVWTGMKDRCYNPKEKCYSRYGGRGITICQRWQDFANFLADMGPRPSPSHRIERIDNDGNYEPSNCRWATHKEQMRNMSSNHLLTFAGETKNLAEWAETKRMSLRALYSRINKYHWSAERALTTPVNSNAKRTTKDERPVAGS